MTRRVTDVRYVAKLAHQAARGIVIPIARSASAGIVFSRSIWNVISSTPSCVIAYIERVAAGAEICRSIGVIARIREAARSLVRQVCAGVAHVRDSTKLTFQAACGSVIDIAHSASTGVVFSGSVWNVISITPICSITCGQRLAASAEIRRSSGGVASLGFAPRSLVRKLCCRVAHVCDSTFLTFQAALVQIIGVACLVFINSTICECASLVYLVRFIQMTTWACEIVTAFRWSAASNFIICDVVTHLA
jgi:hypothetical protein